MIGFRLGKKAYQVPAHWDEVSGKQFVGVSMAFELFETGRIDWPMLKLGVAASLLGVDMSLLPRQNDVAAENFYRLMEQIRFPFRIEERDGAATASPQIFLSRNLFPKTGRRKGYRFLITADGMVDCDITAEQYVDALSLMDLYTKTRSDDALDGLFSTLYKGRGDVSREMKVAVYYNFRGILEYIRQLPDFRLVFAVGEKRSRGANPLGLSASILNLSKTGYGTLAEIRSMDLFTYLGALVQVNIDGILTLKSAGLKAGEIADKMNLPLEEILPYITEDKED